MRRSSIHVLLRVLRSIARTPLRGRRTLLTLTALAAPACAGAAATPAEPLHWAVQLGLRVAVAESQAPILDRVVLVPDAATYLDELSRWSPEGRWPVLFEEEPRTAIFVRRFAPAQLLRRESVGAAAPTGAALVEASLATIRHAWGLRPDEALAEGFMARQHIPAGIVIASVADPAWTAALAIAAFRGQPIAWLEMPLGAPNDTIPAEQAAAFQRTVAELLDGSGMEWRGLGDVIETIAVCRTMAARAGIAPTWTIPSPRPEDRRGTIAMTDLIGRAPDGSRGAFCGWIFGDAASAAYMAMSGLFSTVRAATFVSGYRDEPPWSAFDPGPGAEILRRAGFEARMRTGPAGDVETWRRSLPRGWKTDLLLVNSGGNAEYMILANDAQLRAHEMPLLDAPVAMQMVHSWSLRAPASPGTIGGRFLRNGAYAYVGSVEEPFLPAFVPPSIVADRLSVGVPLLVAARHWEGDGSSLWRVATIGDPLARCAPEAHDRRRRIAAPAPATEDGRTKGTIDLRTRLPELLRGAVAGRDDAQGAEALRILELLGEDGSARAFWAELVRIDGAGSASGRAAIPILFRAGDAEGLLEAWRRARVTAAAEPLLADMLWHLVPDRLAAAPSAESIDAMTDAVRPGVESDLARIRAWRGVP
ncbi:MAG TPA: hypothetical protein PKC43_08110 [Phycisphaerales bacterium]|nr:hypothetical protein [Phycisphaerales bacterium]HMP37400.1 hypothetical protein [Phycisphaerales bacterium]